MEKGSFDVVVFLLSFRGEEERGAGAGDTMAHGNAPWSRRRGWHAAGHVGLMMKAGPCHMPYDSSHHRNDD